MDTYLPATRALVEAARPEDVQTFDAPCDVTIRSSPAAVSAAVGGTILFILVVNGWLVVDYVQETDEELRSGALVMAVFFDLVMIPIALVFGAASWSARKGSVVCSPSGLSYVQYYHRSLIPWTEMLGVQVADSSVAPMGGSVVDRYFTQVLVRSGNLHWWRQVGNDWSPSESRVAIQAGTIEAWRVHFAPPPAAWYPSPEGPGQRYWDGATWTEYVAD